MVKIAIIGWYGTETIGDRAILAGIFSILNKCYGEFKVQLGSIYPFFTERTMLEDKDFWKKCAGNVDVEIFDSQNTGELNTAIKWCDILVMGGGPLMGFWSLYMVEYAFAKAKKLKKHTIVMGCGVGPMIKKRYEKSLLNIIEKSDITIFRDEDSVKEYQRLSGKNNVYSAIDPAVIAALQYKKTQPAISYNNTIIACVRSFPMEYRINNQINGDSINNRINQLICRLQSESNKQVMLLPMHYFAIGGDDRAFMNTLKFAINNSMVTVQNTPLSLEQTFNAFISADQCIGMRFHSVVLQTILNGKNLILDYTDPGKGKIIGFLKLINAFEYYQNSYTNLQVNENMDIYSQQQFIPDQNKIESLINVYYQKLK